MRRLRILIWHIHGSYLYYLTQTPHQFLVLSKPGHPAGYGGRNGQMAWGPNVHELPAAQAREAAAAISVRLGGPGPSTGTPVTGSTGVAVSCLPVGVAAAS